MFCLWLNCLIDSLLLVLITKLEKEEGKTPNFGCLQCTLYHHYLRPQPMPLITIFWVQDSSLQISQVESYKRTTCCNRCQVILAFMKNRELQFFKNIYNGSSSTKKKMQLRSGSGPVLEKRKLVLEIRPSSGYNLDRNLCLIVC